MCSSKSEIIDSRVPVLDAVVVNSVSVAVVRPLLPAATVAVGWVLLPATMVFISCEMDGRLKRRVQMKLTFGSAHLLW
jgi:hypothetical protein